MLFYENTDILLVSLILAALGLPFELSPHSPPPSLLLRRIEEAGLTATKQSVTSIVLEGEMVAYNEVNDMIDEFAYIPECAVGTAGTSALATAK